MKTILNTLLLIFTFLIINNSYGQRVTIDFEEYGTGITLSNQLSLSALGISFPKGVEVVDCLSDNGLCDAGTDGANSGNKVGFASYYTEFNRNPIIIRFTQRQDSVTFYLKPAYSNLQMQVSIEGWADGLDTPVSGGTTTFNNNSFTRYKLTNCDEVRLYARTTGSSSNDNFLIIDDITFNAAEDVEEDSTDPYIDIDRPLPGEISTTGIFPVIGYASDNVQLDTVDITILKDDIVVYETNLCGRAGAPCPIGAGNYEFETTIDLSFLENRYYLFVVRAVDVSGNEYTHTRAIFNEIPPPPPSVTVHRLEVNQAVQDHLFEVDGPGTVSTASTSTPLLPEKNTLVRYYLKTEEDVRYNFSGELRLSVFYQDGSNRTEFISPNLTGFPDVDSILPLPSGTLPELEHLVDMRANLGKTLNFVVSEDLLVNADLITLTLFEGITPISGQLQLNLWPATELGINYYKIKTDTPDSSVFMSNIGNYIENTYPISRLHQSYEGEIIIRLGFDLFDEILGRSTASRYRRALGSMLNGRWPALPYTPEYPHWRVILGVMDASAGGNATLGNASDEGSRLFGVASTSSRGNVGAHEVGHLIGLNHAGTAHGECGGGGCETFVNLNGTLDGEGGLFADFGIALVHNDATGKYNAFLIDPCPVANPADRFGGCAAGALETDPEPIRPFDMMSYGEPATWGGFILDSRSRQWISKHNYRRIYFAIKDRNPVKSGIVTKKSLDEYEPDMSMYLQIYGIIKDDSAYLFGILEKSIDNNLLDLINTDNGEYQAQIFDNQGTELFSRYFEPDSILDTEECCLLDFNLFIPKLSNAHELVVKNPDGKVILRKMASMNKPAINLLSDLGGQNFETGKLTLSWDASDTDEDPLLITAEYSPDMGKTWIPLAYLEDPDNNEISIDVGQLKSTDKGIIKMAASDGFHTTVDITTETFCVKADGSCAPATVTPEDLGLVSSNEPEIASGLDINLFPNPANDFVKIRLDVDTPGNVTVTIYDMIGKKTGTGIINHQAVPGRNFIQVNTNELPKGIYNVEIKFNDEKLNKNLIIK